MTEVLDQRIAEKLARVLGMLGSAHDGERASAAALADKLIRAQGLTWPEIILSRLERITTIESEIDFALANGAGVLSAWEEGFLRKGQGLSHPEATRQARRHRGQGSRLLRRGRGMTTFSEEEMMMRNGNGHARANGGISYTPLDLVENYMRRFIIYPSEHAIVAHVLWIAHTHMMDEWDTTPRIAFMSPLPESGKSRALEITELFVPNPKLSFSISAAAMVRHIAKGNEQGSIPTILFDEIDNVFSKAEEGISDLRAAPQRRLQEERYGDALHQ